MVDGLINDGRMAADGLRIEGWMDGWMDMMDGMD